MPQTPQRKVQTSPLNLGGRANASHFGGQEAAALGDIGKATQSFAGDMAVVKKKHDTFVIQKGYNTASEKAFAHLEEASKLQGENAIGASARADVFFEQLKADIIDGMDKRQQRMFLQNWEAKSISYRQKIAAHESRQVEIAQLNEMKLTAEGDAQVYGATQDPKARADAMSSFDQYIARLGETAETKEIRREEFGRNLDKAAVSTLVEAGETEKAKALLDESSPSKGADYKIQLKSIQAKERSMWREKEQAASDALHAADNQMAVKIAESGNPLYIGSTAEYTEGYGQKIGEFKRNERIAFVAKYEADNKPGRSLREEELMAIGDVVQNPDKHSYAERFLLGAQLSRMDDPAAGQALSQLNKTLKLDKSVRTPTAVVGMAFDMIANPDKYPSATRYQMSAELHRLSVNDKGLVPYIAQLDATLAEQAKNGFVSVETQQRNSDFLKIYDMFDRANRHGWRNAYKGDDIVITASGTVTSRGESSRQLVRWLTKYNKITQKAKDENLGIEEVDALVKKVIMDPMQLLVDEGMTKAGNDLWNTRGDRIISAIGVKPEGEEKKSYIPQDMTQTEARDMEDEIEATAAKLDAAKKGDE